VLAAVVALNLLFAGIRALTPTPSGPGSSSYATSPAGVAAYAELLERSGRTVRRLRDPPAAESLDPSTTVVVLDPDVVVPAEARALAGFVRRGGRLVVGAAPPGAWLDELVPGTPRWEPGGSTDPASVAPVPETDGVRRLRTAGEGSFVDAGGALPAVAGTSGAAALVAAVGRGRIVVLADPSPLQNRLLGKADNARFALAAAGPRGRPVAFAETYHGYGDARGLAALPNRWRLALIGMALAGLTWLVARGRRLGPPEGEARAPAPPRGEYLEALATALARTKRPTEVGAPVQAAARRELARRAGTPGTTDPEVLRRAGERLGLSGEEVEAVVSEPKTEAHVMAAGRALASLRGGVR